MKKTNDEYQRFDDTMQQLLRVGHAEIKAKLDAEKSEKLSKPKKKGKRNGNKANTAR